MLLLTWKTRQLLDAAVQRLPSLLRSRAKPCYKMHRPPSRTRLGGALCPTQISVYALA